MRLDRTWLEAILYLDSAACAFLRSVTEKLLTPINRNLPLPISGSLSVARAKCLYFKLQPSPDAQLLDTAPFRAHPRGHRATRVAFYPIDVTAHRLGV